MARKARGLRAALTRLEGKHRCEWGKRQRFIQRIWSCIALSLISIQTLILLRLLQCTRIDELLFVLWRKAIVVVGPGICHPFDSWFLSHTLLAVFPVCYPTTVMQRIVGEPLFPCRDRRLFNGMPCALGYRFIGLGARLEAIATCPIQVRGLVFNQALQMPDGGVDGQKFEC